MSVTIRCTETLIKVECSRDFDALKPTLKRWSKSQGHPEWLMALPSLIDKCIAALTKVFIRLVLGKDPHNAESNCTEFVFPVDKECPMAVGSSLRDTIETDLPNIQVTLINDLN
jgi:hypothetical protein